MPRFLFACDSFKGTLSSARTAELLAEAAERHLPGCGWAAVPMADGGEGTVDAVVAATGGELLTARVEGPLGDPVRAAYGMLPDGGAVIEMAAASGLPLVAGREDVLVASTLGTGQLVAHALDRGARGVALAIGGSATNDGGSGFLVALGARLLDGRGEELAPCAANLGRVAAVDLAGVDPRLAAGLTVMCDVDNPLLGEHGATRVFGPQKGATPEVVERIEEGMAIYARALSEACGRDVASVPGAGAAGGLGAACLAVGAALRPGIDTVLDLVGFDGLLEGADLVVTGEGRLDAQTAHGKVVSGVAAASRRAGVPCVAVAGSVDEGYRPGDIPGLAAAVSCVTRLEPLDRVLAQADENFAAAADRLFSLLAIDLA
ncbi:glycerate kinase [Atopobiaceae bacterium 24-176]